MERGKTMGQSCSLYYSHIKTLQGCPLLFKDVNPGTDTQQNTTTKSLLQTEPIWQLAGEGWPVKNTNFALLLKKQKTKKNKMAKLVV